MHPTLITLVIPFQHRQVRQADDAIKALSATRGGAHPLGVIGSRLDELKMVHYMSIVAVGDECPATRSEPPDSRDPETSGQAHLMVEITADGEVIEVLEKLSTTMGSELEAILAAAQVKRGRDRLADFLRRHHRPIRAGWRFGGALGQVHVGAPGMGVRRIQRERELARVLGLEVDKQRIMGDWSNKSPMQRLAVIRQFAWNLGDTKWAFAPEPAPCLPGDPANKWDDSGYNLKNPQALKALHWILNTLLWPLYLPFLAASIYFVAPAWTEGPAHLSVLWTFFVPAMLLTAFVLGAILFYHRLLHHEQADAVDDCAPPAEQVEALMKQENHFAQNHMATVSRLKPGLLRRLTLRIAFVVVGSGRFVGAPGFLGKNGVIHSARWMRIPGTSQLMFWSNYDGTWQSYVADFIADAPAGVSAIWSNCRGFPRTHSLFTAGAENRDRLVQWARRQQQPTLFWYSAYPELTAERIRRNAAIRQGLASAASDADARDWFSLFGSSQRPPQALDLPEIPTLVLGGLSSRPQAYCLLVRWKGHPADARRWLREVAQAATFGEARKDEMAVAVALSSSGLKKLGLPPEAMATFPAAFQQDMWPAWRARALGDIGPNAPDHWDWGDDGADHADVVVLIYPPKDCAPFAGMSDYALRARELGHRVIKEEPLFLSGAGPFTEPFGFADGISQPVIRGAPRNNSRALPSDLVAPGEIVLGYPDNTGELPPSPSIADRHDPEHFLPDKGPDPFRRRPEFSRYEGKAGERDLGANGTFLVVRQLKQHREAFDDWCKGNYERLRDLPEIYFAGDENAAPGRQRSPMETARSVGALLAGRWPDGTSLVRNPRFPGTRGTPPARPDNAFQFGAEDPRGLACPFGAHIRRANPRDTRFHATPEQSKAEIASVNRHRILRIGRRWGDRDDQTSRNGAGLMFMCLNADIERQFEFVQKTWLLNPNMHGLEDEGDPIMGRRRADGASRKFTLPTPDGPIKLDIEHDFVSMIGGGYFFMPGRSALRYLVRET